MSYPCGPRLSLREFTAADVAAVHEYASDPAVARWSTWGPNTWAETAAFVVDAAGQQLRADRAAYSLAAVLNGETIGSVGIWVTGLQDRNGGLGYTFHRSHWNQGYATEAVHLLLEFGFTTLELERIDATCHPDNAGSIRVLEKSGFTLEGRLRSHRLVRGDRRDSLLYAKLRHEHFTATGPRTGQDHQP